MKFRPTLPYSLSACVNMSIVTAESMTLYACLRVTIVGGETLDKRVSSLLRN